MSSPRSRLAAALALSCLSLTAFPASAAASSAVNGANHTLFASDDGHVRVVDAHIEGSGPWTALLGGRPSRTLVLAVENTGDTVIETIAPEVTFGRGANPTTMVSVPAIMGLAPGASRELRVPLEFPLLPIGTYSIKGTIDDGGDPVTFRAETSHIPWLLILAPLLILGQLGLVGIRNWARRRFHPGDAPEATTGDRVIDLRTSATAEPTATTATTDTSSAPSAGGSPDLERIIAEELTEVFDDAFQRHDDSLGDDEFRTLLLELAATTAERVSVRTDLDAVDRAVLDREITDSVLAAFGLEVETRRNAQMP